jgi:hypothetical protein
VGINNSCQQENSTDSFSLFLLARCIGWPGSPVDIAGQSTNRTFKATVKDQQCCVRSHSLDCLARLFVT